MILIFFTFLLFAIHSFLTVPNSHAQGEFETDYRVTYAIDVNGRTNVSQEIALKNKTTNFYADKFELKIGSAKIEDVKAQDNVGPLETEVKFDNNVTTISVKFNQKVIGVDKTLPWTLSYTSSELATKSGQIWEVSIPRLAKSEDINSYEAQVSVPTSFGPTAFTLPEPQESTRKGQIQTFSFTKNQLTQSGISMSFGQKQVFQFSLSYFIENRNLTTKTQEITLPPDNNYQKVVIESIKPPPIDVSVDRDGNFVAKYKLSPKDQLDITTDGYVEVFSKSFRNIDKPLTPEEKNKYTQPQRYWETDSAEIKEKARELKTPEAIYNFVANYLSYNEEKLNKPNIERLGALAAYSAPKDAVCMEFTDLFIAIARAAGIPSKEVIGFAYTQNTRLRPLSLVTQGDLLHAWPAYWDDQLGWVQIDPTWGSTSGGLNFFNKLDFNHITLTHRGQSSTLPYPAGSFKKQGDTTKKDVIINFAQNLPTITSTPDLFFQSSDKIIAGIPVKVSAQIKNIGSTSIIGGKVLLEANNLKTTSQNPINFYILPPYSKKDITFMLQSKKILSKVNDALVLSFNDVQVTKPVVIIPIYYLFLSPQFALIVISMVILITLALLIHKKIKKRKLLTNRNLV